MNLLSHEHEEKLKAIGRNLCDFVNEVMDIYKAKQAGLVTDMASVVKARSETIMADLRQVEIDTEARAFHI